MERVDFRGKNLARLDVSKDEKLEAYDCTDNPLKYLKGRDLVVEAGNGGFIGVRFSPEEGQMFFAYAQEGFTFEGWYNTLGDRLSRENPWVDKYGMGREIFAYFREK